MRFRPQALVLLAVALTPGLAGAFAPTSPAPDHHVTSVFEATRPSVSFQSLESAYGASSALGDGWKVHPDPRTGRPHLAYGGDVRLAGPQGEAHAADLARGFLLENRDLVGAREGNLELRNVAHATGKWAVHYRQVVDGIRVYRGNAFVVIGDRGRVMAFGSDFLPEEGASTAVLLTPAQAITAAANDLGATPLPDLPQSADLHLVPVPDGTSFRLTAAYRVVFDTEEPFGSWLTFVDAANGTVLSRENRIQKVNVVGSVDAIVQDFSYCDGTSWDVFANQTVNVQGGNSDDTDADGDFDISHGGASPVTVTAEIRGPYLNVNRYSGLGADASFSGSATPGTPLSIVWDNTNSRQDERDCFFHANRAHDFMTDIDPTDYMDYAMPCVVGRTDGFCPGNAWWSSGSQSINFCEAGSGYENTGEMGNVIYHEYGHGVSDRLYWAFGEDLPSGDMHEGNSDIIANFIDRTPIIGIGFTNCSSGIRNADNNLQWPQDNNGGHFGGQIIAGFYWDSWQEMLAELPQSQADDAAWSAWHNSRILGLPFAQDDQVFWTFVADDDDANLDNGTPHHEYFCVGADNHGFECPEITVGVFVTHEKLPHTEDGSQGFDVVATIVSSGSTLDLGLLRVDYRVNGGSFNSIPMAPTANPDEFLGHIPALPSGSEVEYYVYGEDLAGNSGTSPDNAPAFLHGFDVCFDYDDLESGVGNWTIGAGGDDATFGTWGLFDPNGTTAQPEDDSTPGPGTMAFITGQCAIGLEDCTVACINTCSDVDAGTTTLLSPVYDLSAATTAKVKYDRWYSNDTGLSPGFDLWLVDVSNDGGSSWTSFESTNLSDASWTSQSIDVNAMFGSPGQVQVRFRARDLGNDSVIEAGVDEFRVIADVGATDVPAVGASAEPIVFSLSQNQPNPFRPATRIEFSLPERAEVDLTVFNVNGQAVRTLAEGLRETGRYHVIWDGRDSRGKKVATGVYFYRLVAGESSLTRKMTVMK